MTHFEEGVMWFQPSILDASVNCFEIRNFIHYLLLFCMADVEGQSCLLLIVNLKYIFFFLID